MVKQLLVLVSTQVLVKQFGVGVRAMGMTFSRENYAANSSKYIRDIALTA
jgi:hypothetical protein